MIDRCLGPKDHILMIYIMPLILSLQILPLLSRSNYPLVEDDEIRRLLPPH